MEAIDVRNQNLFDLQQEIDQIEAALETFEESGEDAAIVDVVNRYFADLTEKREDKLEAYAGLIAKYEAGHKIRKEEADRLAKLAKTDENKAKRMKEFLKAVWETYGLEKVSTKFHEFSRRGHGGVAALVVDPDVEQHPQMAKPEHQKVVVELDKAAIRSDVQAGIEVPYATLADRGWSVSIR